MNISYILYINILFNVNEKNIKIYQVDIACKFNFKFQALLSYDTY